MTTKGGTDIVFLSSTAQNEFRTLLNRFRSVLNGFKKHSEWEKGRLFLAFAYAQTTIRVRPNDRLRTPKQPFAYAQTTVRVGANSKSYFFIYLVSLLCFLFWLRRRELGMNLAERIHACYSSIVELDFHHIIVAIEDPCAIFPRFHVLVKTAVVGFSHYTTYFFHRHIQLHTIYIVCHRRIPTTA